MKTPLFPRIGLALLLAVSVTVLTLLPALAQPASQDPLVSGDFDSSRWHLLAVDFDAQTRQAVFSMLWRNTGPRPASFSWTYELFLTQNQRRCQPIPLPSGVSSDDPGALVASGGEQVIRLAFVLPDAQADVLIQVDGSFGQAPPLSVTYSPATGQVIGSQGPDDSAVEPGPTPVPDPTPSPEPTLPPGEATAIPLPIPQGESPDIPMLSAQFASSDLEVVYVNVLPDSATAVLYLQWQNNGSNSISFEWAYDLSLSQGQRRCRSVPLPEGEPSDDPQALCRPGEVQFISQAFALPDPQEDFQIHVQESFGGTFGPLLLTYSPATRQILQYTLPQAPDTGLAEATPPPRVTPVPEPEPTPEPPATLPPEPGVAPEPEALSQPITVENFLLNGRIPFNITARRLMGLMGRMPDAEQEGMLTYLELEYASLPADWTFFLDGDGKVYEMFLMFYLPAAEDPQAPLEDFSQVDGYLTALLGPADLNQDLAWRDGVSQSPDLSPAQAIRQGLQELTSNWYLQDITVTHVLGTDPDGLLHFILFYR